MKHKSVAIVGGGIAGLYAASRLVETGAETVRLFEASSRLGGRIQSVLIPWLPFKAELGAMRFRGNHLLLKTLIDELKIPSRGFDVRPPRLRVRGRSLSAKELAEGLCRHCGAGSPYLLEPHERFKSAEELVLSAIRTLLHDLSFPTLPQGEAQRAKHKILDEEISSSVWTLIKEHGWYDNTPLYKIGFWNLLQHYLSNEAFQLVHDALSLESVLGNWSAAEAIPWFMADFTASKLQMVPDGLEEVIVRLAERLIRDLGRVPQPQMSSLDGRLGVCFDKLVRECRFAAGQWSVSGDGWQHPELFDAIILAVPKWSLQRIKFSYPTGDWAPDWLDDVQAHVLYKLFLLYEQEWWMGDDAPGYSVGRTYTDLPVRQVYYFSPNWMWECARVADNQELRNCRKHEEGEGWSLVMASYSDEHYVNFWRTFAAASDQTPYYKAPSISVAKEKSFRIEVDAIDESLRASRRIVSKVQQQLAEIHGHHIPEPIVGLYKDWGDEPFGGGWHTWNVGTEPWKHRPFGPDGLYFCGEAYSAEQGWIEGALKTVERVLLEMEAPPPEALRRQGVPDLRSYVEPSQAGRLRVARPRSRRDREDTQP